MFSRTPIAAVVSATLFGLTSPPVALAQQEMVLEEVMVTARKREEILQETPIAITAISGAMIEQTQMLSATDLEQRTPNLSVRASDNGVTSALQAYMRGVGQFDFALTVDPGVGMYLDGVYLARTVGANFQLSDIEQVTVLRGPQGTLFGKNTIGGAINVVTRRPSGETNYNAKVIGGEDNFFLFDGYVEVPVTDNAAASLSVLTRQSDGWQKRDRGDDAGNDDMWALRGHLDVNFSEQWNSHFVLDYTDIDQNVYPQVLSDFQGEGFIPGLYNSFVLAPQGESCCETNIDDIDRSGALNQLDGEDNQTWGLSWTNTWDIGDLTLKSITGYRDMDAESYRDADNEVWDYFSVGSQFDVQQFSQEFLLTNASGTNLDWVVGVFYLNEDGDHASQVTVGDGLYEALSSLPPGHPLGPLAVPLDLTLSYDRSQETTSYAAFFNATWHMSDRARLNFAARYTYDEKDMDMSMVKRASQTPIARPGPTSPGACSDVVPDGNGTKYSCDEDWDEFTPKLGVDYDFTDEVMGYAHVSTGFRSGVYNGRPLSTDQISVADPETLTSYEIGVKSQMWDKRLQINAALFYNDYEDQQFLVNRSSGSAENALALVVDNAADSTLWGGELEFTALLARGFTVTGGFSYIDPEYDEFDSLNPDTGEVEDLSDRKFANVPEWTANLLAQYVYEFAGGGSLRLRGDLSYRDEIFFTNDEACTCFERLHADSYTIYNAGISYITADDHWEFGAFGRNLGDEREIRGGFGVDAFGTTTVSFTEPRRYFVSVKYRN